MRSFFKFFNYGEDVDTVDWQTASVQEKVDGSLIKYFYFKDKGFGLQIIAGI